MSKLLAIFAVAILTASNALGAAFPYVTLNKQTNRLSDNGTALTFNGTVVGGGNVTATGSANVGDVLTATDATHGVWSAALWSALQNIDDEGGTNYGVQSLNVLTNGTIAYAVNLTAYWQDYASVVSLGYNTPNPSIDASNNFTEVFIGDYAGGVDIFTGHSPVRTLAGDLVVVGSLSGAGQQILGNLTNPAGDVYDWGMSAGIEQVITNSLQVYNFGVNAGRRQQVKNGLIAASDPAIATVSNIGGKAGEDQILETSTGIYNYGQSAGQNQHLTNSSHVYSYGLNSGNGLSGSYTNIYLFGNAAQPTLTANQHVFGSGTDNYLFAGTGGLGTKATGTITTSATGATNTLNANVILYVTAATSATLKDNAGTTEFSGVTIADFTPIRLQPGGVFTGTSITYATGTASHAW